MEADPRLSPGPVAKGKGRSLLPAELRAAGLLLGVSLGLRLMGLARVRRLLERRLPPAPLSEAVDPEAAADLAALVSRVGGWLRCRCLTRSLVLRHLLARRGVPAELRLGVRREGERLRAHAWVEVDGRPLGEPQEVEHHFAPLR